MREADERPLAPSFAFDVLPWCECVSGNCSVPELGLLTEPTWTRERTAKLRDSLEPVAGGPRGWRRRLLLLLKGESSPGGPEALPSEGTGGTSKGEENMLWKVDGQKRFRRGEHACSSRKRRQQSMLSPVVQPRLRYRQLEADGPSWPSIPREGCCWICARRARLQEPACRYQS